MKIPFANFIVFFSLLAVGLVACTAPAVEPTAVPPPEPTPDPADNPLAVVVLDMVARLNAGDIDGSLAYFAKDAMTYFIGMPPVGMELYAGSDQLRPVWEFCITEHFVWEIEIITVQDDIVTARTKTWMDFTKGLGVAPNDFIDYFQVQNGKIVNYASVITDEALAEFKPALLAVMPAEPAAEPSSETPASDLTVTIAGGTCTHSGPLVLQSGTLTVNSIAEDQDKEKFAVSLFVLDEGKDLVDLMASTVHAGPPSWSHMLLLKELQPGEAETSTITLTRGPVYLVCWSELFGLPIGNAGPFEVK